MHVTLPLTPTDRSKVEQQLKGLEQNDYLQKLTILFQGKGVPFQSPGLKSSSIKQKLDSTVNRSFDKSTTEWLKSSKDEYTYDTNGRWTKINLQPGGSLGARGATNIGNPSISGGVVSTDPVYTVAGAGDNVDGTTDQGFFTWWPVSNSSTCSIVARILSQQAGAAGATAGVMIRESSANNARRGYVAATPGSGFEFHYRTNTAATEAKSSLILPIPLWVRLQRTAGSVQAFQSSDGTTWKTVGTNLDLAFGPEVFLGLGVSARAEGKIAAALFDSGNCDGYQLTSSVTIRSGCWSGGTSCPTIR